MRLASYQATSLRTIATQVVSVRRHIPALGPPIQMLDHKNDIFNRLTVQPQRTNNFILLLIYSYIHIDISL